MSAGPKFSEETRNAIELFKKLGSIPKAASLAGIYPSTLRRALDRNNIKRKKNKT